MKRFFLLLTIVLTIIAASLQAQDDVYFKPEKKTIVNEQYQKLTTDEKLKFQTDYVRHCLKKYHDEKMTGYGLQLAGIAMAGAGVAIENNKNTERKLSSPIDVVLIYGGAACSVAGLITLIDSEKWMKRAYIGPDGIGVRFRF